MKFSDEEIALYLKDHPDFFTEYASVLADIQIPHPHGDRAIPISERQIMDLRERNRVLQDKLSELVRFAEENSALSEKMHRLAVVLLQFTGLNDVLQGLNYNLREDFLIPHMALRIWGITIEGQQAPELDKTGPDIPSLAESLQHPYCGPHVLEEIRDWFGEDGIRLRSFAMMPLRTDRTIGLLVLASEESQRFYPEMGTIYLAQLGELASAAIRRFASA
ncbi:MAG: hypothetical protein BGO99_15115 [Nitrosospira sp. 56-18]|mgnify:FL=1|jgi:uncharacterized protein YigA (DUF484 family)|nr:DUF484 family protein [Nitrosospira sp.]OJY13750.1 MAG: hypothetical protein BGO99_15115 [Nitrosospira sp. 56-18]